LGWERKHNALECDNIGGLRWWGRLAERGVEGVDVRERKVCGIVSDGALTCVAQPITTKVRLKLSPIPSQKVTFNFARMKNKQNFCRN